MIIGKLNYAEMTLEILDLHKNYVRLEIKSRKDFYYFDLDKEQLTKLIDKLIELKGKL